MLSHVEASPNALSSDGLQSLPACACAQAASFFKSMHENGALCLAAARVWLHWVRAFRHGSCFPRHQSFFGAGGFIALQKLASSLGRHPVFCRCDTAHEEQSLQVEERHTSPSFGMQLDVLQKYCSIKSPASRWPSPFVSSQDASRSCGKCDDTHCVHASVVPTAASFV